MKYYKVLLGIGLTLFYYFNASTAIVTGTLINTPNGFISVENLNVGDRVIGFCFKSKEFIESTVKKITKKENQTLYLIETEKENLIVSEENLFFDATNKHWVKAKNMTEENILVSYEVIDNKFSLSSTKCNSVKKIETELQTYELSLEYPHTFFITKSSILTHNFACVLGLGFAFGSGVISFESIGLGVSFLGLGLYNLFAKNSKNKTKITLSPSTFNCPPKGNPEKEEEEEDKKKKKDKKEHKKNTMSKTEFFKTVKDSYKHHKGDYYKKIPGADGLDKNAEYLRWDKTHGDVEAYNKNGWHTGDYDPKTLKMYRPAKHVWINIK